MQSQSFQVSKQASESKQAKPSEKTDKGIRDDLEELDSEELYFKFVVENPNAGRSHKICEYFKRVSTPIASIPCP